MSQRRPTKATNSGNNGGGNNNNATIRGGGGGGGDGCSPVTTPSMTVVPPSSLSLEDPTSSDLTAATITTASTLGDESKQKENENGISADVKQLEMARTKKWKESPFAAAMTETTWEAERKRQFAFWNNDRAYQRVGRHETSNDDNDEDDSDYDFRTDSTGCLCCSAMVCPYLRASRLGNMAVLHSSTEKVEEVDEDLETGEVHVRRYTRPTLVCLVGPYWPMLVFVTYPIIFIVSGWAYYVSVGVGDKPFVLVAVWFILTGALILALGMTGCRDPGILYRHAKPPPQFENSWRWSDQAHTYRPRGAHFDVDTGVVVEGFDHTCPWTGTAIGRKNMVFFQSFVCLVFICLIMDILLISGAL